MAEIPPQLLDTLGDRPRVAAFTGAGISAESGVPTFRDAQTGLWARFSPEDLATPEAFRRDPKLVWQWYAWRRELVARARPNPGHQALAELEDRLDDFTLITQNVDGLHQRAGSRRVLELHGNLFRTKRLDDGKIVQTWDDDREPPRCPDTQSLLRPDVVWFGEMLPEGVLEAAMAAARDCEVFLSIGTSTQVYPAAQLPYLALSEGALVVEINPQPTPLTELAHFSLRGPAGEQLPALVRALGGAR